MNTDVELTTPREQATLLSIWCDLTLLADMLSSNARYPAEFTHDLLGFLCENKIDELAGSLVTVASR